MPAVSSVREELMFVSRQQRVTAVLCCHSPCHATLKISRSPRGRGAGGRQHDEGVHSAIAPLPAHRTQTATATAESSGKRTVPDERGTPLWERETWAAEKPHTGKLSPHDWRRQRLDQRAGSQRLHMAQDPAFTSRWKTRRCRTLGLDSKMVHTDTHTHTYTER